MLEEIDIETRRMDYMAVTQSAITRLLASYIGADYRMPDYMAYMYPDMVHDDKRTADEVVSDLRRKLAG